MSDTLLGLSTETIEKLKESLIRPFQKSMEDYEKMRRLRIASMVSPRLDGFVVLKKGGDILSSLNKKYIRFSAWLEDEDIYEEKYAIFVDTVRDSELFEELNNWIYSLFDSHDYDRADGAWKEITQEQYEAATCEEEYID